MDKILVVDDDLATCEMLCEFLNKKNYDASIATSGQEALAKIKIEKPQAILLDIRMPGMDGIEVLRQIKKIDKNIVVIMITAVKEEETGKAAMKLGASDYITKPLSFDYLDTALSVKLFMQENFNK